MKDFFTDLIDNDTLCLLGVLAIGVLNPTLAGEALAGLLAFMGLKQRKQP